MNRHRPHVATWPILIILTVLFILAVKAPRSWEAVARRQSMLWLIAERTPRGEPTPAPSREEGQPEANEPPSALVAELSSPTTVVSAPAMPRPGELLVPVVAPTAERIAQQAEKLPSLPPPAMPSLPTMTAPLAPSVAQVEPPPVVKTPPMFEIPPLPATVETASRPVRHARPPIGEQDPPPAPSVPVASAPAATVESAVTSAWWPVPTEMFDLLTSLETKPEAADWARQVRQRLELLSQQTAPAAPAAVSALNELHDLSGELNLRLPMMGDSPTADELRRTGYALARRLDLWSRVVEFVGVSAQLASTTGSDARKLAESVRGVVLATAEHAKGEEWRNYLLLDALESLAQQREQVQVEQQRQLVERVLARLDRGGLSAWSAQFASSDPLVKLRQDLRSWNHQQIDPRQLLWQVEQYEASALPSHARLVAQHLQKLRYAPTESEQRIAQELDTHYRNANVRISFTDDLMNLLLPREDTRNVPVNDTVLGHPTHGWSRTTTICNVRFIPDPHTVRMSLEAHGAIFAQTYTVSGPVKVFSDSDSSFRAAKELRLNLDGIATGPAEVVAATAPRLKQIKSKLDFVPFVRGMIQGVAKSEYEESQPQAEAEAKRKIRHEVKTRLDAEVAHQLQDTNEAIKSNLVDPLVHLGITPQVVEANTTQERVTMRLRVAGESHLAGHGPRPRAPSDSLASVQLHESVLNNVCQQFGWEGKDFTYPQLCEHIATKLHTEPRALDENLADLRLRFATENPIRVRLRDGRLGLYLKFALLAKGKQTWHDFEVKVFYRPDLAQPRGQFVRDGTIQLSGTRLNVGAQIALRGIFSKAFPEGRTFKMIPDRVVEKKPGLASIEVTQCDIRDGWMGIALGDRIKTTRASGPVGIFRR